MARDEKHDAEVLPPREALSLINADPSAYAGLLADPTAAGAPAAGPDPTAGAGSAASSANDLVDADAAASGEEQYSDDPQTVSTQDSQTASSQT